MYCKSYGMGVGKRPSGNAPENLGRDIRALHSFGPAEPLGKHKQEQGGNRRSDLLHDKPAAPTMAHPAQRIMGPVMQ